MLNHRVPGVWLLLVLAAWGGWQAYRNRPVATPAGRLAPAPPEQRPIAAADAEPWRVGRWQLTPLATIALEARVLGREDYRFDALASLVPTDLALGWGAMSDRDIVAAFDIRQRGRFYFRQPRAADGALPIPRDEVIRSSANMHLIPADAAVARTLDRVRVGARVRIEGRLVAARADGGVTLRSSLRRDDSGAGACEVIHVEALTVLD